MNSTADRTIVARPTVKAGETFSLVRKSFRAIDTENAVELCGRCSNGITPFHWVQGGVCFECGGVGHSGADTLDTIVARAQRRQDDSDRKDAKRNAAYAKAEAARDELLADPILALAYEWALEDRDSGYTRLWGAAQDCMNRASYANFKGLSDKQADMVRRAVASHVEREAKRAADAEKPAAPTGRQEIEGVIVGQKFVPDNFSYHGGDIEKWTIEAGDGWRVFVTAPRNVEGLDDVPTDADGDHLVKGRSIVLTVTLEEPNDGDARFRLGKRPTKARLLPQEA